MRAQGSLISIKTVSPTPRFAESDVEAIFRYPVKSMGGERLEVAKLGWHGASSVSVPVGWLSENYSEAEVAFWEVSLTGTRILARNDTTE
jgi:hypothetical protein